MNVIEPLTLEQLRFLHNHPVWVEIYKDTSRSGWKLCWSSQSGNILLLSMSLHGPILEELGQSWFREYNSSWAAYAYPPKSCNTITNWIYCDECKPSCKLCINYNGWDRYGKPQVCIDCKEYSNFESDDDFCSSCGRPLTEHGWSVFYLRNLHFYLRS